MQAVVGQQAPFDHGRRQLELLAGLQLTAKAVERTAEGIGEDIGSKARSSGRCSGSCRWWWGNPSPSCTSKWTGPEFRW